MSDTASSSSSSSSSSSATPLTPSPPRLFLGCASCPLSPDVERSRRIQARLAIVCAEIGVVTSWPAARRSAQRDRERAGCDWRPPLPQIRPRALDFYLRECESEDGGIGSDRAFLARLRRRARRRDQKELAVEATVGSKRLRELGVPVALSALLIQAQKLRDPHYCVQR